MYTKYKDFLEGEKMYGEMLVCIRRSIFIDNKNLRFLESINGGEGILFCKIVKKYHLLCVNKIARIYHKDAENSLVRQNLDKRKALNVYGINKAVIDNFKSDLVKYNKKSLSTNYFTMASMLALTGKKTESLKIFFDGVKIAVPSFKNMIMYLISVFDIKFILYNFINKLKSKFI